MNRAEAQIAFYRSLAGMLDAGVPVSAALAQSSELLPGAAGLAAGVERGGSVAEAFAARPDLFPPDQARLVALAEKAGRIDHALRDLAALGEQRLALRRAIVGGLVQPVVVFHAAAVLAPLPAWFGGGSTGDYLLSSLGLIAAVWAGVGALAFGFRRLSAAARDRLLRGVPLVGATWCEFEWWRVAAALAMLTNAGVPIIAALREAVPLCRGPRLARALREAADSAEARGESPLATLASSGQLSRETMLLWRTGEECGRLAETLADLTSRAADRCEARLIALARWTPRLAYLLVCVWVAARIAAIAGALPRPA